jgi:hypothetical protein
MVYESERWKVILLCDKASTEQDPRKLSALILQICELLVECEKKESRQNGISDSNENAYPTKAAAE